ncbi:MAG: VWA domain-containing protein [Pyrinomonadaceae bacterium]
MRAAGFVLLILCITAFCADLSAQTDNGNEEEITVDTQFVEVPIVVTDKSGKPILNLKQNNFVIFEDGKKQEVTDFLTTTAPFEVALLLDTSGSARSDLALIQRAAESFIASLRPGDRVAVISFRSVVENNRSFAEPEILSELTDDRVKLKTALSQVKTSNGTPYYDALLQIAEKIFKDKPKSEFQGRRALVALTDGVDSSSSSDFSEAAQTFSESGIVSYFIQVNTRDFFEENLLGDCQGAMRFSGAQIRRYYKTFYSKSAGERVSDFCQLGDFERLDISKRLYGLADTEMNSMAKNSGGKVFPAADLSEARSAFKKVADEIGTKYSLGYYPSNEKRDGTYRKIKVELKNVPASTTITAREGYTAPKN